jgi:hypothetical protein
MIASRPKSARPAQLQSSTLILPMPACAHRSLDAGSPWVSVDPVFIRECAAAYRSVRLVMLALIAFLTAPKLSRSESSGSGAHAHHSSFKAHTPESEKPAAASQAAGPQRFSRSALSLSATRASAAQPGFAHQLKTPPQKTLIPKSIRAHAPPASPLRMLSFSYKSKRTIKLKTSPQHNAPSSLAAYRGIPSHSVIRPGFTLPRFASVITPHHTLAPPPSNTATLESFRAHAPPAQSHQTALYSPLTVSPLSLIPALSDFPVEPRRALPSVFLSKIQRPPIPP